MINKAIFLGIIFLTYYIKTDAQNLDLDIIKSINPENPNSGYWKFTSGSTYFISAGIPTGMLITGLVKNDRDLKRKSYEIFGAIGIELLISESMKIGIDRPRPAEKYPKEIFPYRNISGQSFPSGHTSLAFATAATISLQCKKWYITIPAYLWAGSVGYSRMYLGVHYFSDVSAGAIIGVGSAYLSHWVNRKLFLKKQSKNLIK